jgi:hypothetical protein
VVTRSLSRILPSFSYHPFRRTGGFEFAPRNLADFSRVSRLGPTNYIELLSIDKLLIIEFFTHMTDLHHFSCNQAKRESNEKSDIQSINQSVISC